jgi:hypothetical protein
MDAPPAQAITPLVVTVHEAKGLKNKDIAGAVSDPYAVVDLWNADGASVLPKDSKQTFKTGVVKSCLDPIWNTKNQFDLTAFNDYAATMLSVTIWDKDLGSSDDFMGQVRIPLADLIHDTRKLYPLSGRVNKSDKVTGELILSITHGSTLSDLKLEEKTPKAVETKAPKVGVPNGARVATPYGPGEVVRRREQDSIYEVTLDWTLDNNVHAKAYLLEDQLTCLGAIPAGTRVNTPYGPGVLGNQRAIDSMYEVTLDWKLDQGVPARAFLLEDEITSVDAAVPSGAKVQTPYGPGVVEKTRARDNMYEVTLDWKLDQGAPARAFLLEDEITRFDPVFPSGTKVQTPYGPGVVEKTRARDNMHEVILDWTLDNNIPARAYLLEDQIQSKTKKEVKEVAKKEDNRVAKNQMTEVAKSRVRTQSYIDMEKKVIDAEEEQKKLLRLKAEQDAAKARWVKQQADAAKKAEEDAQWQRELAEKAGIAQQKEKDARKLREAEQELIEQAKAAQQKEAARKLREAELAEQAELVRRDEACKENIRRAAAILQREKPWFGLELEQRHGCKGLFVKSVKSGSCCDVAGLQSGDILLESRGRSLKTMQDFRDVAQKVELGLSMACKGNRTGSRRTWTLDLGSKNLDHVDVQHLQRIVNGPGKDPARDAGFLNIIDEVLRNTSR